MKPRRGPEHRHVTAIAHGFDRQLLVRNDQGFYLPATADQILAAARHAIEQKVQRGAQFGSSQAVKDYLRTKLCSFEHEVFSALFLDGQHRLIEYVEMFRGTLKTASVYPREVVKEALRFNAAAVILSHNHPGGNPEPTRADEAVTQQLSTALAMIDVRVLDHIIVAGSLTLSFAEHGLL